MTQTKPLQTAKRKQQVARFFIDFINSNIFFISLCLILELSSSRFFFFQVLVLERYGGLATLDLKAVKMDRALIYPGYGNATKTK